MTILKLCSEALRSKHVDFTKGDIKKAAFLISFPSMLEFAMESLFVLIDLIYVSSLGELAITLVGITNIIVILLQSFAMGIGITCTALISRRVGEKRMYMAGHTAGHAIYLILFLSVFLSIILFIFSKPVLTISGASTAILRYGLTFAELIFIGLPLVFLRIVINGIFRGYGVTYKTFRVMVLLNVFNVILCPVFMYGFGPIPEFGITGVAIASLLSNLAAVFYQLYHLISKQNLPKIRKFDYDVIKKIVKLSSAGTIQFLVPSTSRYFMIIIVAQLGVTVITAYIIANRIILFLVLPAWGIANAAGILVGQNLGANQPGRAEKSVWKITLFNILYLACNAVLLFAFAKPIVSFFTDKIEIINISVSYLHYMTIAFLFFGFTMVLSRAINAAGAIRTVTLLYILMFYVTQLPLAYWLGIHIGWKDQGIFIAILISELVLATACIIVFKIGNWKKIKI